MGFYNALKKNRFEAEYVADRKAAFTKIVEKIPSGATIGCGDSVTLHQIGFFEWLREQKHHEVFHPSSDKPYPERFRLQQKVLTANVFVTGTNAITADGKIVSIDARGNRVAPMIFGPNKTIFVAGENKIVNDVDDALKRIHEYAAPINARRHVVKHGSSAVSVQAEGIGNLPCAKTGSCHQCKSENKICRITVIIDGWSGMYHCPNQEHQPFVIIVGESLGI